MHPAVGSTITRDRMSRRGDSVGPTLTPRMCKLGVKVRTTASSGWMGSMTGIIVGGEGTMRPRIRFENGLEREVLSTRLQVLEKFLTPEQQEECIQEKTSEKDRVLQEHLEMQESRLNQAKWNF